MVDGMIVRGELERVPASRSRGGHIAVKLLDEMSPY
jgi:hypothetical protein